MVVVAGALVVVVVGNRAVVVVGARDVVVAPFVVDVGVPVLVVCLPGAEVVVGGAVVVVIGLGGTPDSSAGAVVVVAAIVGWLLGPANDGATVGVRTGASPTLSASPRGPNSTTPCPLGDGARATTSPIPGELNCGTSPYPFTKPRALTSQ